MTQTTVEIEKQVTEEQQLTICDDCQREVDSDGFEYGGSGDYPDLHFCSECLERMTDGEFDPSYVERASGWVTSPESEAQRSVETQIEKVDSKANDYLWAGFILGGIMVALFMSGFTIPMWALALYGFGGLWVTLWNAANINTIKTEIEKVK